MNIAEAIRTFELQDLAKAFKPRKNKYFNWSWRKQREGEDVKSLCDYILYGDNTNWRLFNMIDVANFDSDHCLLKGKLISSNHRKYNQYIKTRSTPPVDIYPPINSAGPSESDQRIKALQDNMTLIKHKNKDRSWISEQTFTLLRPKAQAIQRGDPNAQDLG